MHLACIYCLFANKVLHLGQQRQKTFGLTISTPFRADTGPEI